MKIIPKEIKRRARAALTGYYFPAVSMTISLTLFTTALSLLVSASGLYGIRDTFPFPSKADGRGRRQAAGHRV